MRPALLIALLCVTTARAGRFPRRRRLRGHHAAGRHADGRLLLRAGCPRASTTRSTPRRSSSRRGGKKAALVGLDLISTTFAIVDEARQEIEKTTGIKGADVMISATHAHTGPVLQGRGSREDAFGGKNPLARKYGEDLPGKIAEAVRRAEKALRPAKVAAAHGSETSIAFNRRFHMIDGTVGWNPGKLNPKIVKPAGTIDPDVAVVYFETDDKDRKPLATYVNYAVHLDNVGGTKFSADMPATVSDLLGRVKGPDMVTLYTAGCCGDINHIDVNWAEPPGRPRERRPDGRDPRGRGAADLAEAQARDRPARSA